MRVIIKKLAQLFLVMAIAGSSMQFLYASTQPQCEHASAADMSMSADHCQQMEADEKCKCKSDCGCKIHISYLSAPATVPVTFQYQLSLGEVVAELSDQYSHYYFNPLLRPPIS